MGLISTALLSASSTLGKSISIVMLFHLMYLLLKVSRETPEVSSVAIREATTSLQMAR